MSRLAVILSGLLLALAFAGVSGADPQTNYVPLGTYGDVTIAPTFAGVVGLTIKTPQWSYGALQTQDYQGTVGATINNTGQVWIHPDYKTQSPRLVVSSPSYGGPSCLNDPIQEIIGSSVVWSVDCGGADTSYNYYSQPDGMQFKVEDNRENLAGGIDASGRFVTLAHSAPDPRDMGNGEARVWFNPDPNTGGMEVTMKYSNGVMQTVRLNAPPGQTPVIPRIPRIPKP